MPEPAKKDYRKKLKVKCFKCGQEIERYKSAYDRSMGMSMCNDCRNTAFRKHDRRNFENFLKSIPAPKYYCRFNGCTTEIMSPGDFLCDKHRAMVNKKKEHMGAKF